MAEEMGARLGQREVLLGGLPEALEITPNRARLTGDCAHNRSVDRDPGRDRGVFARAASYAGLSLSAQEDLNSGSGWSMTTR